MSHTCPIRPPFEPHPFHPNQKWEWCWDAEHRKTMICAACQERMLAREQPVVRLSTEEHHHLACLLNTLGLVRRIADHWNASGGPHAQYLAGRVLEVLDADESRLATLKAVRSIRTPWSQPPVAQVDEEDRHGRRTTLGETP